MDSPRITEDLKLCKLCEMSRKLAEKLIDEKGLFDEERGKIVLENFSYTDPFFVEHVKNVVASLMGNKKANLFFKRLSFPLASKFCEKLIQKTLSIDDETPLEKKDLSVALLFSLFVPLRQTVGSCFATAPLIYTQTNQPLFLLEDLYNLLTRGYLKRTLEGEEIKVPISIKVGKETNEQSLLLKCYEFTAASFSDWKIDFYKWNMFASLGLDHKERGGLGEAVFEAIQEVFDETKKELEDLKEEIEAGESDLRVLESAINRDHWRKDIEGRAAYLTRLGQIYEDKRSRLERIGLLYRDLIDSILKLFPFYFQEVYDPDMQEGEGEIYEDVPSGYRLLFKHGRADPAQWNMIYSEGEYITALELFFQMIRPALMPLVPFAGGEDVLEKILQTVILRLHEPVFLGRAKERVAQMHSKYAKGTYVKTPWSYLSGGNTESFIKCYYGHSKELTVEELFPKQPLDLLSGLIEFLKDLPYEVAKPLESPLGALLMTSPTHAFLLKPSFPEFLKAWHHSANTYTYIRDSILKTQETYYHKRTLTDKEKAFVERSLEEDLPNIPIHGLFQHIQKQMPHQLLFAEKLILTILLQSDLPRPIAFADTNWKSYSFAFILSPITLELELWLLSPTHVEPIPTWKAFFGQSRWAIYRVTAEYKSEK